MSDALKVFFGLLIPLTGTTLGAAMIFLLRKNIKPRAQKALLGFASGVMLAAAVWSLLIPAIEMAEKNGVIPWLPALTGFLLGVGFLRALDLVIPHLHAGSAKPEGAQSGISRSLMLVLAVTLHNIPEGMAVGVVFAGVLSGSAVVSSAGAFALALGIALQNFPEGAMISMPLAGGGVSKRRAFLYGFISGAVEPVGALLTLLLVSVISPF